MKWLRPIWHIFKLNFIFILTFCVVMTVGIAHADDALPVGDFFTQVIQTIQKLGGLPWVAKIASIVLLVIASMKVSFLNDLIWKRLGKAQAWIAPILGLASGILMLGYDGKITLPGVFAYLAAGAGALILHELLDTAKAIPGIGPLWVTVIGVIEGALGGSGSQPVAKK